MTDKSDRYEKRSLEEIISYWRGSRGGSKWGRTDYTGMVNNGEIQVVCDGVDTLRARVAELETALTGLKGALGCWCFSGQNFDPTMMVGDHTLECARAKTALTENGAKDG